MDSGRSFDIAGKRRWPHRRKALALLVFLGLAIDQARAQFAVCNQSLDVVNVSIGREVDSDFQSEGWWTIGANQCSTVIREQLTSRYIYVYANDVFDQPVTYGSTQMCIAQRRFTIRGTEDCFVRGFSTAGFIEVDTQTMARWTLFLTPQNR
ncbi:DUF1036 domain-containing protein [Fulvimarina sp. MAC3]|uniref:DUF1036 domain-containing protein n=1 Tax=Fulvimarina sp. MAC3 TaxID=3148887 RepID=UPI0031FE144E